MMEIYRFMEIDTCPMCGGEVYPRETPYIGKSIEEIPYGAEFELECREHGCGVFTITRRDPMSLRNDWIASYAITARHPNDQ